MAAIVRHRVAAIEASILAGPARRYIVSLKYGKAVRFKLAVKTVPAGDRRHSSAPEKLCDCPTIPSPTHQVIWELALTMNVNQETGWICGPNLINEAAYGLMVVL